MMCGRNRLCRGNVSVCSYNRNNMWLYNDDTRLTSLLFNLLTLTKSKLMILHYSSTDSTDYSTPTDYGEETVTF